MSKIVSIKPASIELSYEHIVSDLLEAEPSNGNGEERWSYHIEVAKKLLRSSFLNRMAVAEIAVRASIIKSGGDRHSENFNTEGQMLTLRAFAEAVGMNPSTLYLWVSIKTEVFDKIAPADRELFQHDAGEKTYKRLGKKHSHTDETVQSVYQRFANQTKEQKSLSRLFKYVLSLKKIFLKTDFWKLLTEEQLDSLRVDIALILKAIVDIQSVKKKKGKR